MRKVFRGFQRSGLFWQILATLLLLASHHPQHQCLAWQIPPIRIASSSSSQRSLSLAQAKNDNDSDPPAVFPLSTRAALIQNAKSLDIQLATGSKLGSYSPQGWSNRLGTVLTPASIPGVYTGDRPFLWNGIDVSCRMVVVQLQTPNNQDKPDLWIHSPVGLDAPLKAALATLGRVKYVVSPNYEHLKFAPQWAQEYPDAQMWGCPGLVERMPDIQWAGEIPNGIRPSSWTTGDNNKVQQLENCWDLNEIEPLHINVEVNPATGTPFFNEVIFFHKPSQTLITTDLYWNYPQPNGVPNSHLEDSPVYDWELAPKLDSIPTGSKLFFFGMNRLYLPIYKNIMIQGEDAKAEYQRIAKFLLDDGNEWGQATTLIPAHGDLVRGRSVIQKVLKKQLL